MPPHNRLRHFKSNSEKVGRYKTALGLLLDSGVQDVLLELGSPVDVDPTHPQSMQMNAFANQQRIGYLAAVDNIFNLLDIGEDYREQIDRDYGSKDRLVDQGFITEAEKKELDADE
jgi:hypothetical protein